jgi:hypothetical protein
MPHGGSQPGERRGGRKKGTPNKRTAALRAHLAATDSGFDPYGQMETLANELLSEIQQERAAGKPNQARIDQLRDMLARVLRDMVPYKRPRLAAMKVQGDPNAPLFDLTGLTDAELAFLRRTVLKATQIEEEPAEWLTSYTAR